MHNYKHLKIVTYKVIFVKSIYMQILCADMYTSYIDDIQDRIDEDHWIICANNLIEENVKEIKLIRQNGAPPICNLQKF